MTRVWPLLLLAGCANDPTTVLVRFECTPAQPFETLRLRVRAATAGLDELRGFGADAGALFLPDALVARFDDRALEVQLDAEALDGRGLTRRAATAVTTVPHQRVTATLDLSLPAACDDGARGEGESDVDCGGPGGCPRCAVGSACLADGDCEARTCADVPRLDGGLERLCSLASGPPYWRPGASLSTRAELGVAVVPGAGIVAVGGLGQPDHFFSELEVYDEALDAFRAAGATLPRGRYGVAAALHAGRLVVVGGLEDRDGGTATEARVATVESWAPLEAVFRPEPPLSAPRARVSLGVSGDKLYAIGGSDGAAIERVEVRDAAGRWSPARSMPTARQCTGLATLADGTFLVVGGDGVQGAPVAVVEQYRPADDVWVARRPLPAPRSCLGAVLAPDGRVWAVGGDTGFGNPSSAVEVYDATSQRWLPAANLGSARLGLGVALTSDGRIAAVGGFNTADHLELYGPAVHLAPSARRPGERASVTGDNFAASAAVRATLLPEGVVLAEGATDAQGALTAPLDFAVPAVAPGAHPVVVVDERSRYPVTLTLTVLP